MGCSFCCCRFTMIVIDQLGFGIMAAAGIVGLLCEKMGWTRTGTACLFAMVMAAVWVATWIAFQLAMVAAFGVALN